MGFRKRLAVWIHDRKRLDPKRSNWWALELIKDFEAENVNEYHKFLWTHHMAYASTYEIGIRFGRENMAGSRLLFFSDLDRVMKDMRVDPVKDVSSVFEVGCSLGYQLRHMETDIYTGAGEICGADIDGYAIKAGTEYLEQLGSRVRLMCADMEDLELLLGDRTYDIIVCTGTLMYLTEESAAKVVDTMVRHTRKILAISGLADPEADNSTLLKSGRRETDRSFIHNIDSMVKRSGGIVLARRWEGDHMIDGHSIYFVFASNDLHLGIR
ncbi:MAG: class I SAM-dependent methyltransferase [bacterium]